jgi:hypothetical protein
MSRQDVEGGLAVVSPHGEGKHWYVEHEGSGLPLFGGYLHQKRFAAQARADFLGTGVDFTAGQPLVTAHRNSFGPVVTRWRRRAMQDRVDPVTGEHYSWMTHYGQVIPSRAHAERIAAAMASYAWS